MTGEATPPALRQRTSGRRALVILARVSPAALVAMSVIQWAPGIQESWRLGLVIALAALALAGSISALRVEWLGEQARRTLENRLQSAEDMLASVEPHPLLMDIAGHLFGRGMWRLAVYEKRQDAENGEHLSLLSAASSDGVCEQSAPHTIRVMSSQFAEVFSTNLADKTQRKAYESGGFLESTETKAWTAWREKIFGGAGAIGREESGLRVCKYAWYATQVPGQGRNVVAIAESAHAAGINFDFLDSPSTAIWLVTVARMSAAKRGAEPAIAGAQELFSAAPGAHPGAKKGR